MSAVPCPMDAISPVSDTPPVPFATVYVTLSKQEHIRLVMDANSWKGLHRKATERAEWIERRHRHELLELKQQAAQRAELVMKATADRWRALRRRAVARAAARAAGRALRHQEELRELKDQGAQREAELGAQLEVAHAKVRDLQKRLFGRKSESRRDSEAQAQAPVARAPRGHLRGALGHGRTMQLQLPQR